MKEGLRSSFRSHPSDQILEEDVPLITLITKKKSGNSSAKRVTFDLTNVTTHTSTSLSLEDQDQDCNSTLKRKRNKQEDVVYVKRNRLDVFEYNEDDLLEFIAIKNETQSVASHKTKKRKKTSAVENNRGIDVFDNGDDAKPIRSLGQFKRKSKVSRKNVSLEEDGVLLSPTNKNVEEADRSEAEMDTAIDVFGKETCVSDEDNSNLSVGKVKRKSKVSHENCVTAETGLQIPDKEKKAEEADHSEADEIRISKSSPNSIGRRTRSSVNAMKIETVPPAVEKKPKSSNSLLASKIKQSQLRGVEKGTSSRSEKKDEGRKESKKDQRIKGRVKTEHNLQTKVSQKKKNPEKQAVREQIQRIVEKAGWTIEYRRRQSKEYSDAVYVDLDGHAYWSCIKAYDALLKQYKDQESDSDVIHCKNGFSFMPLPEELLNKLTRLTKKKIAMMNGKSGKGVKKGKEEITNPKAVKGIKKGERANKENSSDKKHVNSSKESRSKAGKLRLIKKGRKAVNVKLERNGSERNRKNAVKRSASTQDTDEVDSDLHNSNSKRKTQGGFSLLVRDKEVNSDGNNFVAYPGKLSVLSWLIDSEILPLGGKVKYMNKRRTRKMLEGLVTRDGISCSCCSEVVSISEFETHAGSVIHQPSQNIFLEDGVPLFQCQIDAWNKQEESKHSGFYFVDITSTDPNDDTCCICGDGGDLICCDGCPSTFHQSCLDIKVLPKGDWLCSDCCCKFCGLVGCSNGQEDDTTISKLLTCSLCEEKYHEPCTLQKSDAPVDSDGLSKSFCGKKCAELFEHLQKLLGVKHELEPGYSWTIIRRFNLESDTSICELPHKVECNSKLALALNIMDECFMTTIDERSGINLLHNVVYNCSSNFKRLNYTGFYTFLLERNDEIISAASVRIRGARFAEMPFIGTRYKYRRQGMARRLLNAIELALGSLDIEKLIIPAVKELENTWTANFGFIPLEESFKQEAKFLNMLVFPGVAMLQKLPLKQNSPQVALTNGPALEAIDLNKDENANSDGSMDLNSDVEIIALDAPAEEALYSISQRRDNPTFETKSLLPEKGNADLCLKVNGCVLDLNAPMDGFESDLHSPDITKTPRQQESPSVMNCNGISGKGNTRVTRSRVKMLLDLNKFDSDGLETEVEPSGSSSTSDLVQKAVGDHDSPS